MTSPFAPFPFEGVFHAKPGQSVRFSVNASVLGTAEPAALTLTLACLEPGATDAEIVDDAPVNDGVGEYHSDQVLPLGATAGRWARRWQATGLTPNACALIEREFQIDPLDF